MKESFKEKFLGSDAMMVVYLTLFLGWIMSFFVSLILGSIVEFFSWEINDHYLLLSSFAIGHAITAGMAAKQVYED